jgi:hypothetical protein
MQLGFIGICDVSNPSKTRTKYSIFRTKIAMHFSVTYNTADLYGIISWSRKYIKDENVDLTYKTVRLGFGKPYTAKCC